MPNGSGGALILTYDSPINVDSPSGTENSLFPNILGTSSQDATLIGQTYLSLQTGEAFVSAIADTADDVESSVTGFNSKIDDTLT